MNETKAWGFLTSWIGLLFSDANSKQCIIYSYKNAFMKYDMEVSDTFIL